MAKVQRKRRRQRLKPAGIAIITVLILSLLFSALLALKRNELTEDPEVQEPQVVTGNELTPSESDAPDEPEPTNEPETTEKPETTAKSEETRLSFVAFGDNLIHSTIIEDGQRRADESGIDNEFYFDPMYEDFKDIVQNADIAFINQETPIAGTDFAYSGYPNFNTPEEMGNCLVRLGFDVINTATNHMLDCRGKGLLFHADYWASKADEGVIQIGSYKNKADYENIRIYEKEGIKIAFLAYTYSTNGMTAGSDYSDIYIPYIDNDEMTRQVARAKELADLVFVSMHWGDEDSFDVNANQRDQAQALVDAGVDVIIGTHPHVVQEMKWKTNSEGHQTLIAYSLGNFISTMYNPWNMFGGYLSLDIVKDEDGVRVENPLFNPTMCHYSLYRTYLKLYLLEDYSQELYEQHGTTLQSSAYSYDKIIAKIKSIISDEFLTDYYKNYGEE